MTGRERLSDQPLPRPFVEGGSDPLSAERHDKIHAQIETNRHYATHDEVLAGPKGDA